MTSDERALMSAILADPSDDHPRHMLANWLEEQGNADRAAFIRVQLELAEVEKWLADNKDSKAWPFDHTRRLEALRQRERELWHTGLIHRYPMMTVPCIVRRGLLAEVHCTLQAWMGGPCQTCTGGKPGRWVCKIPDPKKCPHCNGAGTIPGHGPAIVAAHPVERVLFSDAVIHASSGNDTYYVGGLGVFPPQYWSQLENLLSRQAAHDALSRVAIAWAKQQANGGQDALACHQVVLH